MRPRSYWSESEDGRRSLPIKMTGGHCPSRWQEVTCAKGKFSGGFDISACIWCTAGRESVSKSYFAKTNGRLSSSVLPDREENVRFLKLIDVEVERVRGFPVDTIAPCRERLKILG
ncbi:hypothetical protein Hanom_Chr06g00548471 [Helianthus anomalus]